MQTDGELLQKAGGLTSGVIVKGKGRGPEAAVKKINNKWHRAVRPLTRRNYEKRLYLLVFR